LKKSTNEFAKTYASSLRSIRISESFTHHREPVQGGQQNAWAWPPTCNACWNGVRL